MALGPDGSVYVADTFNNRVRRIKDGVVSTVAGSGATFFERREQGIQHEPNFGGDGGPATSALLNIPKGVTVAADGTLYIADSANNRIRRVNQNGTITTLVGTSEARRPDEEGTLALQTTVDHPEDVEIGGDGSIYFTDTHRVRRLDASSKVFTVAGNWNAHCPYIATECGDGGPATEASLDGPNDIEFAPDGSLFIAEDWSERVRKVSPEGIISIVTGDGYSCGYHQYTRKAGPACGDGGLAWIIHGVG